MPFQGSPSGTVTYVGQGLITAMPKRDILFLLVGTTGLAGRFHCWVASQEQGLTKSFLLQGRKACHKISRQKGKSRLFAVALTASAVAILEKPKRRLVRWDCKTRRKKSWKLYTGWIPGLSVFISCSTIPPAGPSPGLDAAEKKQSYNPSGQAPASPQPPRELFPWLGRFWMMLCAHCQTSVPHAASLHALSKMVPSTQPNTFQKTLNGEGLQWK